jgi:hypothetical protein
MSHRNKAQQNFSRGLQTVTDIIGNKKVQASGLSKVWHDIIVLGLQHTTMAYMLSPGQLAMIDRSRYRHHSSFLCI